jgi:hypothetical protein
LFAARHRSGSAASLAAAITALVLVAPAQAQRPRPPEDASAILQYVEAVPTAGGDRAVGVGVAEAEPLPPAVAQHVEQQAGPEAEALKTVATSSAYGAPQIAPKRLEPTEPTGAASSAAPSLVAAGLRAAGSGGSERGIAVLAALLGGITVAAVALAVRRQRGLV